MSGEFRLPGIRRAGLTAIGEMRRQLDELERSAEVSSIVDVDPRDEARSKSHAAFLAAVDVIEQRIIDGVRWSRNRIAAELGVDPVTLKDWIENGHKKRDQIPGWIFPRLALLPECAWSAFCREALNWRAQPRRSAAYG